MRAYTSTCLSACWLLCLQGCSGSVPDDTAPTLYDETQPDAGPTYCNLEGTWEVKLGTVDPCAPSESGAVISLTVDDSDADLDNFAIAEPVPSSTCGPYMREVHVSADGCTITASSHATWCSGNNRSQCSEYQLTLHARDDAAEVEGVYRRCWCGSPGPYGKKVEVSGRASRR